MDVEATVAPETLQWHEASCSKPDSDTTVLAWIVDAHGSPGDWWSVWWDAEQERWIDAATGAKVAGLVTHWCEPAGPGAWMENVGVEPHSAAGKDLE